MSNFSQAVKFFELMRAGKNCALDVKKTTGEVVCQFTFNRTTQAEGAGTPPIPMTHHWSRVAQYENGVLVELTNA